MPTDLPHYVSSNDGQWVVVKEHNRSAHFRNPHPKKVAVLTVLVDNGLIVNGERADYVVSHPQIVDIIVELKGSDIDKAVRQITSTVPVWKSHTLSGAVHAALVVRGQGVRPKALLKTEKLAKQFREKFKMKLLIETRNREYEFQEFV